MNIGRIIFRIIYALLILACLVAPFVDTAGAFDVKATAGKVISNNKDIKSWYSYEVQFIQKGLYLSVSNDNFEIYGGKIDVQSASVGYQHKIAKPLSVYGQVGYYKPVMDGRSFGWEALWWKQTEHYGFSYGDPAVPICHHYTYDLRPDFGAEAGVIVSTTIYKNLSISGTIGYRYLKFWEDINGYHADGTPEWIMSRNQDFGGVRISAGIGYEF